MQTSLFCPLIDLIDEGTPVSAPEEVVYSTQPRKATALDGHCYYTKGPDLNIVTAELVAHQLALELALNVPEFGIAFPDLVDGPLFASKEVPRCHRQVDPWIKRDRVTNPGMLPLLIAFDIWVMNKDRNIGNLVGHEQLAPSAGRIAIVAIDFEKSMALRGPYPLTATPNIDPRSLWPSGTLGQMMTGAPLPNDFCASIGKVGAERILDAFARVEARINQEIPWKAGSVQLLSMRSKRIINLVKEVWR